MFTYIMLTSTENRTVFRKKFLWDCGNGQIVFCVTGYKIVYELHFKRIYDWNFNSYNAGIRPGKGARNYDQEDKQ